jgi:hypothetical protein
MSRIIRNGRLPLNRGSTVGAEDACILIHVSCLCSNRNPLHLIEAHLVAPAIVELGGAGRGVVRHGGTFEHTAVFQVRRDAGCAEGVIGPLGPEAVTEYQFRRLATTTFGQTAA